QKMLGRAYAVALPAANSNVERGLACWQFTHQSGVAALSAPVSGRVKEINSSLRQRPALINRDPYGEGWTVLIEPGDLKACLKHLMYGEQIRQWLGAEIEKLRLVIDQTVNDEDNIHMTMTDGGILTQEFMSGLTVAQRQQVICSFFPLSLDEEAERNHAIKIKDGR
ncbi:MAG: glycine cleavage system protein H, partial [Pyrinomonadaceae bacterium]